MLCLILILKKLYRFKSILNLNGASTSKTNMIERFVLRPTLSANKKSTAVAVLFLLEQTRRFERERPREGANRPLAVRGGGR